ncbi:MAG: mechanosensitive ion channel [Desulfobacterales bacterium]|nr:mechanosensitive ion channel [Desulfobacterales bacterium]
MIRKKIFKRAIFIFTVLTLSLILNSEGASAEENIASSGDAPAISLPEDMGSAMSREVGQVKEDIQKQARSLFERTPLGWNRMTIDDLAGWFVDLPAKAPSFWGYVKKQGRLIGFVGSLLLLAFILAVFYSFFWQDRILARLEKQVQPLTERLPPSVTPYLISTFRVIVGVLLPLILLGLFSMIIAFIPQRSVWLVFTRQILLLWLIGALVLRLLGELLLRDLLKVELHYGKTIFLFSRLVTIYALSCIAFLWGAEAFRIRDDVQALFYFIVALSIVCALLLLVFQKKALLSFLPQLPYKGYQTFLNLLDRFYLPVMLLTFLTGLLWCFGFRRFAETFWVRTWLLTGVLVLILGVYHLSQKGLRVWIAKKDPAEKQVQFLYRSFRMILIYATLVGALYVTLRLLGFQGYLQRVLSFPLMHVGQTPISVWLLIEAAIILIAFIYLVRLLQAYLDYKVYPSIGVEPGMAYALNTFIKYFGFAVGIVFAFNFVGFDLRAFMVFAGAAGIGIGLGLQSMAANIISGFSIVFGRKIRKDDWIQVGDTRGVVTDIYLRASKLRTRDNIEYLIPNSDFMTQTTVNYTLSSPLIRVHIPVGVSYDADPEQVRQILLEVAKANRNVHRRRKPEVFFDAYGDSSINFDLLVWMDLRKIGENRLRSELYYKIFEALKKAGIEIPFPQRDLHIRSGLPAA